MTTVGAVNRRLFNWVNVRLRTVSCDRGVECQFLFIDRNAEPGPLRHDELKVTVNRSSGGNIIFEQ
jgi:hypothetical protein